MLVTVPACAVPPPPPPPPPPSAARERFIGSSFEAAAAAGAAAGAAGAAPAESFFFKSGALEGDVTFFHRLPTANVTPSTGRACKKQHMSLAFFFHRASCAFASSKNAPVSR